MTADLTRQIEADIKHWTMVSPGERAQNVLDWCEKNSVDTASIFAAPLAMAMSKQPYWLQGPSNYLDMVNSIVAFLASR